MSAPPLHPSEIMASLRKAAERYEAWRESAHRPDLADEWQDKAEACREAYNKLRTFWREESAA